MSTSPGLKLLVVVEGRAVTHRLSQGTVLVGRCAEADIQVDSPGLSRRHARLFVGDRVRIQDCSSANGTVLRGQRLAPGQAVEVGIGETIELGDCATLVVQSSHEPCTLRRLWPHGYFEALLDEECARAARSKAPFTVLRVAVGGDPYADQLPIHEALSESFRASDIVASYAPSEYEVLLVDADAEKADAVCRRLVELMDARGLSVRLGRASFPVDGRSAQALIAASGSGIRGGDDVGTAADDVPTESAIARLDRLVERVAKSKISIVVLGETGVGKEVMARRIHQLSDRADKPFVTVNCGALAETLLESELFGYERGAFTGATTSKPGLLDTADGGTVFLDEVGEMPMSLQVKLLRVLEQGEVLPVGAVRPRAIDVRLLAATNRNLEEAVALGSFRQDLFYRLNGMTITVPPLRERVDEIEALARVFLERAGAEHPEDWEPRLTPEALKALKDHFWPGNIRELRNVIERAVILCGEGVIKPEHLPVEEIGEALGLGRRNGTPTGRGQGVRDAPGGVAPTPSPTTPPVPEFHAHGAGASGPVAQEPTGPSAQHAGAPPLKDAVQDLERQQILNALERFGGNQTHTARHLGISRGTLASRMERFGIPRPRKR